MRGGPRGPHHGVTIDPAVLRRARLAAGFSLAQLAGPGLTRQAVSLMELGKARPSMRSLRYLAGRLGIPAESLLPEAHPDRASGDPRADELEHLCETQRYDEAATLSKSILDAPAAASPRLRAVAHFFLGRVRTHQNHAEEALDNLGEARRQFEVLRDPWLVAESLDWHACALYVAEDVNQALTTAREALARYRSLQPRLPTTEARMLEHVGMILLKAHQYDESKRFYEEAVRVAGGTRELVRMSRVYHGLSLCHDHLGDLRTAIEYAEKALALYTLEHQVSGSAPGAPMARIELEVGYLVMKAGQLDRAEALFQSALQRLRDVAVRHVQSHVLRNLAELRERQGRLDDAVAFARDAVDVAAELHEVVAHASAYEVLGRLHATRGDTPAMIDSFERALAILESADLKDRRAEVAAEYQRARDRSAGDSMGSGPS